MKSLIVVGSLFVASSAYAQEGAIELPKTASPALPSPQRDEPETLADNDGNFRHIKFYGAPAFGITSVDGGVAPAHEHGGRSAGQVDPGPARRRIAHPLHEFAEPRGGR